MYRPKKMKQVYFRRSNRHPLENNIVPIIRIEAKIPISMNGGSTSHRTQFSLILAFACTVHKVQGLTLLSTVVCLELNRQNKSTMTNYKYLLIFIKTRNCIKISLNIIFCKLYYVKHLSQWVLRDIQFFQLLQLWLRDISVFEVFSGSWCVQAYDKHSLPIQVHSLLSKCYCLYLYTNI